MTLGAVASVLRERLGFDADSLGPHGLHGPVHARLQALGLGDARTYAARLAVDAGELERLLEDLLVRETWCFRYPASFEHLQRQARAFLATGAKRPFRALSAPCATGEEPASIAVALLQARVPADRIQIDAIDVCRHALEAAERGRFSMRSLRGASPAPYRPWLRDDPDGLALDPDVHGRIRYRHHNLLDPSFAPPHRYDAVFCRNLLIYLTEPAREALLERLRTWLRRDGLLYVGHAELGSVGRSGFDIDLPIAAFALRVTAPATKGETKTAVRRTSRAKPARRRTRPATRMPPKAGPTLKEAASLANRGHLDEALRMLEQARAEGEPSARLFHLLSTVHTALGDLTAARHAVGRALYLDREHYPSLVQAALLAEAQGDHARAARLRDRASRIHAQSEEDGR